MRLGHNFTSGNSVVYSSDVTASVWQDFSGDNNATITAIDFPAAEDPGQTIGDLSLNKFTAATSCIRRESSATVDNLRYAHSNQL